MNPDEGSARRLADQAQEILAYLKTTEELQFRIAEDGAARHLIDFTVPRLANALLEALEREDVYKDSLKKSAERREEAETQWSQMRHRVEELEEALQELVEAAHWVLTSKGVNFDSIGALMKARDRGRAALEKGEEG